jgi:hypothetical protein
MVDLSAAQTAVLSFTYWRDKDKPERFVTLQISGDVGAAWTDLIVIEALDND